MRTRLTAPAASTPVSAIMFAQSPPRLVSPMKNCVPVLHAHAVEEEREPQRSDHRRRHRLRREPAHGECDEEHRSHAERESLDVDFAHQIADGDRQEQRHQRLLLEQCLD